MTDRSIETLAPSSPMPVGFAVPAPPQWRDFLARHPWLEGRRPATVEVNGTMFDELRSRFFDAKRAYRPDAGGDNWDCWLPGDCENQVLWIRLEMAEKDGPARVPLGALRPVLCRLRDGRGHLVGCLCTRNPWTRAPEDYIVDPLEAEPLVPWVRLSHRWIARQEPGDPEHWRLILAMASAGRAAA